MLQNSAMLVALNISAWSGRKQDRKVSDEIDVAKKTKTKSGNYSKHLLAGTHKLDELHSIIAATRKGHRERTLRWSDGSDLLPMKMFFEHKSWINDREQEINVALEDFLREYPTLVSAAAFQLGDLFDASEYPDVQTLRGKFKFSCVYMPVPASGDFRVDVNEESMVQLRQQYEQFYEDKLKEAAGDAWNRLYECVKHMSDRLADAPTPRETKEGTTYAKIFHTSMITNANELCDLLTKLNVTNDSKLESARQALEWAINGKTVEALRASDELRIQTKARVDAVLDMF